MGCSFQHGCLNARKYDKGCGVSKCTEPMVARHDLTNTSDILQWGPSHPTAAWLITKDFLCPCLLFYYSLCYQSSSSSALAENKPETPFKVTSPMCLCHSPLSLSQQSFNPQLCTSTSAETEFLHPHHTHRLGGLPEFSCRHWMACPHPLFSLMKPFPDLKPQARVQAAPGSHSELATLGD